jgi:hypothetical protein
MRNERGLFPWWVTRVFFSLGAMSIFSFVFQVLLRSAGPYSWVLIPVGLALIVVSIRGPWDSEASGRNRSVLGFKARPGPDQDR